MEDLGRRGEEGEERGARGREAYGISGVDVPDVGVGGDMRAVGVGEREGRGAVEVSICEVVSVIVGCFCGIAVVFWVWRG